MRKFLVTFAYTGLFPFAPGSVATAAAAAVFAVILVLAGRPLCWMIMVPLTVVASVVGLPLCAWAERAFQKKDPRPFVLDEVAGYWVTVLFLPEAPLWQILVVSFLAFRIFDVLKPPPIRQIDRLTHPTAIMWDDLAAGVASNLVCQVLLRL